MKNCHYASFSESEWTVIFSKFWKETNQDQRKKFKVNHVCKTSTKRVYPRIMEKKTRNFSVQYFSTVERAQTTSLQKMFPNITGLGEYTVHS